MILILWRLVSVRLFTLWFEIGILVAVLWVSGIGVAALLRVWLEAVVLGGLLHKLMVSWDLADGIIPEMNRHRV